VFEQQKDVLQLQLVIDHPRSGVVYNFGRLTFWTSGNLHGIRVKFVYEGHRVKVKVTGAKKVKNPYSRNVKLRSAITPVL